MALHKLTFRTAIAAFGIVAATVWNGQVAHGQYSFKQDTNNNGAWTDITNWIDIPSGNPATDYPNAPGATVLITAPISTNVGTYSLNFPATDVTVGEIKIDNSAFSNNYAVNFVDGGGQLIFQSSSGTAKYTETLGTGTTSPSRYTINNKITLNSDLELTQNNVPSLNTGTIFNGLITGDATRTITKKGTASIQFNYGS